MPITLGSQTATGIARRLEGVSAALSRSFETLGSGSRINRAADDAAGLAISASLNADSRVFGRALLNLNDGISVVNIAQGALQELGSIVMRQKELAEQAANGIYAQPQRDALNREAGALTDEYNRIVASTKVNNISLFAPGSSLNLQAGRGEASVISLSLGLGLVSYKGDGTFSPSYSIAATGVSTYGGQESIVSADFNGDGYGDLASVRNNSQNISFYFGNGDGSFKALVTQSFGPSGLSNIWAQDVTRDGKIDLVIAGYSSPVTVLAGNGDGTFSVRSSIDTGANQMFAVELQDVNNDQILDLLTGENVGGSHIMKVRMGNGDGTFRAGLSFATGTTPLSFAFGDFDRNGTTDVVVAEEGSDRLSVLSGNGDGTFKARVSIGAFDARSVSVADLNHDGKDDIVAADDTGERLQVYLGRGDGFFDYSFSQLAAEPSSLKLLDLNGDGHVDVLAGATADNYIQVALGNGDGSFRAVTTYASTNSHHLTMNDFNGDGVKDVAAYSYSTAAIHVSLASVNTTSGVASIDLSTAASARTALSTLSRTSESIERELGAIGGFQSRLGSAINHLHTLRENYQAAESRIKDADVAVATAEMLRNQIVQQSGVAVMAQSRRSQSLVMELLRF